MKTVIAEEQARKEIAEWADFFEAELSEESILSLLPSVERGRIILDEESEQFIKDFLGEVRHEGSADDYKDKALHTLACRAAVMAGDRLSSDEVRNLLLRLFGTNNPYCCPHGRPTFIKITQEELDGRFGRT